MAEYNFVILLVSTMPRFRVLMLEDVVWLKAESAASRIRRDRLCGKSSRAKQTTWRF